MKRQRNLIGRLFPVESRLRDSFALVPLLAGLITLLGWAAGFEAIKPVFPGLLAMSPNTAFCFLALSAGLLAMPASLEQAPKLPHRTGVAALLAAVTLLAGMLTLFEYITGISLGIDQLIFSVPDTASPHPGRPAAESASALTFAGAALLLLSFSAIKANEPAALEAKAAHMLALVPASFGYLSLAGYLFGIRGLYSFGPFNTTALSSGIASAFIALGLLFTAPDAGWRRLFADRPLSLGLLKRMLPLALSLPLLFEAAVIWGGRLGAYEPLFGAALVAFAAAASSATLTWISINNVRRAEELSADATKALAASEERFRGIFMHAATGIAITDMQGRLLSVNPSYARMLGFSSNELQYRNIQNLVHPDDRESHREGMGRLLTQQIASFETMGRSVGRDGAHLWLHNHVSLLRDSAGSPINMIVLVSDMTERKLNEEHIRLLMSEVNHRSKNILTLVQAIARQTAATSPEDFLRRFDERIGALAASQDLLVKSVWRSADLDRLIRSQLAHFKDLIDNRIELAGPSLSVTAHAAQALGMALHELATNAGKYGALSNARGSVKIEWDVIQGEDGKAAFVISWSERGGPPVEAPARRGFGSTVIGRLAEQALNAKVTLRFPVTGLIWRLECPATQVTHDNRSSAKMRLSS